MNYYREYLYQESSGLSSGSLVQEPLYLQPYHRSRKRSGNFDLYFGLGGNSLIPLAKTLGGIVGYKRVQINNGQSGGYGYKVNEYTSPYNFPNTYLNADVTNEIVGNEISVLTIYNYHLDVYNQLSDQTRDTSAMKWGFGNRTNLDHRRGKLTTSKVYNASDKLLKKTENKYWFSDDQGIPENYNHTFYRGLSVKQAVGMLYDYGILAQKYFIQYEHQSSWNYLKERRTVFYDEGTGDSLETTKRFEHDSSHLQISEKVEVNSNKKDSIRTLYIYAHEKYPI